MSDRQIWRYFDWKLFIAVLVLCGIGIGMIYSATANTVDLYDYWERQVVFVGMGLAVLFAVALIDYRHFEVLAIPAYLFLLLSLAAVYLFGTVQGGAQRWLNIGGTLVQPAEAGKFTLTIFMAWYLSRFHGELSRMRYLVGAAVLLSIPLALIYVQPDLGMTIALAFIGGALILVSGIRLWQLVAIGGVSGLALPFLWDTLQGYMVERIQVFLNPAANPAAAFNVNQAMISIGAGGWLGRGWGHGSQNQLHFLRVRHTDFIFSVIAEELGFIGSILVLLLLFFVIWRLVRIADMAQDHFGRLLCVGVAALIFFQTFINVGMNLSLVPVTGITLPFISYGGSSLLSVMSVVGLAQSVAMRHRKIDFQ